MQLLDTLRAHFFLSRFALTAYGSGLTSVQAYVLEYLDRAPDFTLSQIAQLLGLNKSSVSRAVHELVALGHLRQANHTLSSARRSALALTRKGRALLDANYLLAEGHVLKLSARLSSEERVGLLEFLSTFAEGCAAPAHPGAESDPRGALFVAMRRLSLAHGLGSGNFFGSGFPITEWALLTEIDLLSRSTAELSELFAGTPTSLSQLLRRFEDRGLLKMQRASEDKRRNELELTEKGKTALAAIEQQALEGIDDALAAYIDEQLFAGVQLFTKYVGPSVRLRQSHLGTELVLSTVRDSAELVGLRWEFVRTLAAATDEHYPLGSTLFSESQHTIKFEHDGALSGAVELQELAVGRYRVVNLFSQGSVLRNYTIEQITQALLPLLPQAEEIDFGVFSKFR